MGSTGFAARFEELVLAGKTRSASIGRQVRTRLQQSQVLDRLDPLAIWLEGVAALAAVGQVRSERLLFGLKFRARLLHDRLRLSRWVDWTG